MDVELSYFEIPLCTDPDEGKVELVPWPFLLPSVLVSLLQQTKNHSLNGLYLCVLDYFCGYKLILLSTNVLVCLQWPRYGR
jgi:hypothetical protein